MKDLVWLFLIMSVVISSTVTYKVCQFFFKRKLKKYSDKFGIHFK